MRTSRELLAVAAAVVTVTTFAFHSTSAQQPPPRPAPPPTTRDAAPTSPQAPTATGAISGTLVATDSNRPVRRARVSLTGGDQRVGRATVSDDQGGFTFNGLGPGDYTLTANKPGYLDVVYGQRQPGTGRPGTPIHLAASQRLERIRLSIPRGAVVAGTVRDEAEEPAFGAQVRVLRYVMRSGERTLQQAGSTSTDDRGAYRIGVLLPGEYIVSATSRDEMAIADMDATMTFLNGQLIEAKAQLNELAMRALETRAAPVERPSATDIAAAGLAAATTGYAPVFFPGVTQASAASSLTLAIGEERNGIDFQLPLVPLSRISGMVVGPDGAVAGVALQLIDPSQPPGIGTRASRTSPDGKFTFSGVPPGQYTIVARLAGRSVSYEMGRVAGAAQASNQSVDEAMKVAADKMKLMTAVQSGSSVRWALVDVTADGRELSNIALSLQEGMTISGGVAFESATGATPDFSRMTVTLVPVGQSPFGEGAGVIAPTPLDATGHFVIRGVLPGRYRVVPSAAVPSGYAIKSSVFAGRDTLDFPVEVKPGEDRGGGVLTFSTRTSDVSGTLQDSSGKPAPEFTVVVFAAETQFWTPLSRRIQAVRPSTDGRFSLRSLPPGEYRLVAVTDVEPGQWFDPTFLQQAIGGSISFSLAEGEKKVQDLRVR